MALTGALAPSLIQSQETGPTLPRVSHSISTAERDYFHLFRHVDGYVRADLRSAAEGALRCVVHRRGGDSLVLELDSLEHVVFAVWLRQYERLCIANDAPARVLLGAVGTDRAADKMRAFSRLHMRKVISIDRGRFDDPARPMIVTRGGDTLRRPLLAVSESALFIWDGEGIYDATTTDRHLRRISADSIRILEIRSSLPFGSAFPGAAYIAWSFLMHSLSRDATGDEKESIPMETAAWVLPIPAAAFALVGGWWVSLPEYSLTYSAAEDSLAVHRAIPRLLSRSLFGTNVPPELYRTEIAGEAGMKVYGAGDSHPYEDLSNCDRQFPWMLGLETLVHAYGVHARPLSALIGISVSRSIPVTRLSSDKDNWHLAFRPRISAGTFVNAECCVELTSPQTVSIYAGIAYTHVFEDLGKSSEGHLYQRHYTSRYERNAILQESFVIAGMSFGTSFGSVEFQLRHVLKPALYEQMEENLYSYPYPYELTVFGTRDFAGGSIIMNVRL